MIIGIFKEKKINLKKSFVLTLQISRCVLCTCLQINIVFYTGVINWDYIHSTYIVCIFTAMVLTWADAWHGMIVFCHSIVFETLYLLFFLFTIYSSKIWKPICIARCAKTPKSFILMSLDKFLCSVLSCLVCYTYYLRIVRLRYEKHNNLKITVYCWLQK